MTTRLGYLAGFVICAGLIAFAFYLQYVEYQDPCPLCILQRMAFVGLAIVFLIAALHGSGRTGSVVYGGLLFVIAGAGAGVAARHVWLQSLPKAQVPECGPGLDYMLSKFPLGEVLQKVLRGSGECAEAGWRFLGLTIAGWSLLWLVLMAVLAVCLAVLGARHSATR
jgi:protein dithiol:quinone oxidoreductase